MPTIDKITSIVPITVPSNSQNNETIDKDSNNSGGNKLKEILLYLYFDVEDQLYSLRSPSTNHVTRSIDLKSIKSKVIYEIYLYSSI